jgi:hypothetical protein
VHIVEEKVASRPYIQRFGEFVTKNEMPRGIEVGHKVIAVGENQLSSPALRLFCFRKKSTDLLYAG